MEQDIKFSVEMRGERETPIEFPAERTTTTAAVTLVGDGRYRLDTMPLFVEGATFGDVIEADLQSDGKLVFRRVVERSQWRVFGVALTKETIGSDRLAKVLAKAEELGAHWERVFGGLLFICVPPEIDWDPTKELARA
jgi:hypothetical protein